MQKNVEFHDSMKNIAKIIETQYELSYIIPLIGEMIDKFVSNHLIYIFLRDEETENYNLCWPNSCRDDKILGLLSILTPNSDCIMTADKKTGLFPLLQTRYRKGETTDKIRYSYIFYTPRHIGCSIQKQIPETQLSVLPCFHSR